MQKPSYAYHSNFKKWDQTSWVRSKPHRIEPFEEELFFYSKSLAALFHLREVRNAPEKVQRDILVHCLYNYLEFTVWLELGPVNEVCDLLRRQSYMPWMPASMKNDALKIYVDEGGHAEMSHALIKLVEKSSGVNSLKIQPAFLETLDRIVDNHHSDSAKLIKVFFVIISETLITSTLVGLPKDKSVQKAVRDFAEDHAIDEGKHHAYFRQLFELIWERLSFEKQKQIGKLLPKMILAFLYPDTRAFTAILQQFPGVFESPHLLIKNLMNSEYVKESLRESATSTIKMLEANNLFEIDCIKEAFLSCHLIQEHPVYST